MHTFAYKAMDLGTKGADRLQEKMLRVLAVLNSQLADQQQQQQQADEQQAEQQQQEQQLQQQPEQQQEDHDPMQPATETAAESSGVHQFTLSDVQAAARVDPQWLSLAADTLEARLSGIQQALQVRGSSYCRIWRVWDNICLVSACPLQAACLTPCLPPSHPHGPMCTEG
jgi:hypothetical protein